MSAQPAIAEQPQTLDQLLILVNPVPPITLTVDPGPTHLTAEQYAAFDRIRELFAMVVVNQRRELTPDEADLLRCERETIDEIVKVLTERKDAIRTAVFAHLDVVAEREKVADRTTPRHPKQGFYLLAGEILTKGKRLCREISDRTKPYVDLEVLAEYVSEAELDAVTSLVRVLDEPKAMVAIRTNPRLLAALRKATKMTGNVVASLQLRKV